MVTLHATQSESPAMNAPSRAPSNSATSTANSTERARAFRARQRAKGLKLKQFWVPDLNDPSFITEAHRQSKLAAESPYAKGDQDFVDSISEFWTNPERY
jgi:hypothetical protein